MGESKSNCYRVSRESAVPERALTPHTLCTTHHIQQQQQQQPPTDSRLQDDFQDQAEFPRGQRGPHQQADQHGVLRQLRLSLHELVVQQGRPGIARVQMRSGGWFSLVLNRKEGLHQQRWENIWYVREKPGRKRKAERADKQNKTKF